MLYMKKEVTKWIISLALLFAVESLFASYQPQFSTAGFLNFPTREGSFIV